MRKEYCYRVRREEGGQVLRTFIDHWLYSEKQKGRGERGPRRDGSESEKERKRHASLVLVPLHGRGKRKDRKEAIGHMPGWGDEEEKKSVKGKKKNRVDPQSDTLPSVGEGGKKKKKKNPTKTKKDGWG